MEKGNKKIAFIISLIVLMVVVLSILVFVLYSMSSSETGISASSLENPLQSIILANTNKNIVDENAVIQQGILDFNEEYVNYILSALGVGKLHSGIGFGNPKIEIDVGEVWSSEKTKKGLKTSKISIEEEDIKITINKEETVRALLSDDISQFMKNSVSSGNTKIEMVTGKLELFSKGYLGLYKELTGDELEVE